MAAPLVFAKIVAAATKTQAKKSAVKAVAKKAAKDAAKKAATSKDEKGNNKLVKFISFGLVASFIMSVFVATAIMTGIGSLLPDTSRSEACVFFPDSTEMPPELENDDSDADISVPGDNSSTVQSPANSVMPDTSIPDMEGNMMFPLPAQFATTMSSSYGSRIHPITRVLKFHYGTDIPAPTGTPIYAMGHGKVVTVGLSTGDSGPGNYIDLEHNLSGKVIRTRYLHLSAFNVKLGDMVSTGQTIGKVGSTGGSTGAHLHFEVLEGRRLFLDNVNPKQWLKDHKVSAQTGEEFEPTEGTENIYSIEITLGATGAEVCDLNDRQANKLVSINKQWGGYNNGEIPQKELKELSFAKGVFVSQNAAETLESINELYKLEFKKDIKVLKGYESRKEQEECIKKEKDEQIIELQSRCSSLGLSPYGWGMSILFGKPLNDSSTDEYKWLQVNGKSYGWLQPSDNGVGDYGYWEYSGTGGSLNADGKTPEGAKKIARALLPRYGWSVTEFQYLEKLWMRESSWNYQAANPSSSARGIPQALVDLHFKNNPTGKEKYLNDPRTQIDWGLNYIKGRYKNPKEAWDHSELFGWY